MYGIPDTSWKEGRIRDTQVCNLNSWVARWAYLFSELEPGWESCLREHAFSLDLPFLGKGCTPSGSPQEQMNDPYLPTIIGRLHGSQVKGTDHFPEPWVSIKKKIAIKKGDRYLIHSGFIFHGICYFHHRRMEPLDIHFERVHVTQQLIRFSSGQAFNTTNTTVRAPPCCQPPGSGLSGKDIWMLPRGVGREGTFIPARRPHDKGSRAWVLQ